MLPVKVAQLQETKILDSAVYLALLRSKYSIDLYPKVSAYLQKIKISSGQRVKKNQLLISFECKELKSKVKSQAARLETVKNKLIVNSRRELVKQAQLEKAQAELDFSQSQFNRYEELYRRELISKEQREDYQKNFLVSQKNLNSLAAELSAKKAELSQIKSELVQEKHKLAAENSRLSDCSLRAPFEGIVGDILVNEGEFVDQRSKLGSLMNNSSLEIKLEIPVKKINLLNNQSYLQILDQSGEIIAAAKIDFIDSTVNPLSQSVLIKAVYQNKRQNEIQELKNKQRVKVRVVFGEKIGFRIPREALKKEGKESSIFILEEKTKTKNTKNKIYSVRQKKIKISREDQSDFYFVSPDLEAGQRFVSLGSEKLRDHSKVFILP